MLPGLALLCSKLWYNFMDVKLEQSFYSGHLALPHTPDLVSMPLSGTTSSVLGWDRFGSSSMLLLLLRELKQVS